MENEKLETKNNKALMEIVRFLVVGVGATLIDFVVQFLLMKLALGAVASWNEYVAWAIATTAAFIIATIFNFILSKVWVYQEVDKDVDTKSQKIFWIFFVLGLAGWLLGMGLQELGVLLCNNLFPSLNLTYDFTKVSLTTLFGEAGLAFWVFCAIFCLKTVITLIFNYITRKKFIFKAPKEEVAE